MFIFLGENNTGLPPVPIHHRSPVHTLKVTDISVKLNCSLCNASKLILSHEKINIDFESFVVWVKPMSD